MKALLLKDFYTMAKYSKTLLAVVVFYGAMAFLGQQASFLSAMLTFLLAMFVISSFSYDEFSKWNNYCVSLPFSRRQMVGSKYLLALIMIGLGMALGLVGGWLLTLSGDISFQEDILPSCLGSGVAAFFMLSVLLPLIYRFGVEKSRILLLAVCFLPVILILGVVRFAQSRGIPMPDEATVILWLKMIPFIAGIGFLASYFFSVAIFTKKEL